MLPNRFTVVLDANVLGPALPRNIALSLAEADLYRPRWSGQVLDEAEKYIAKATSDADNAKKQRAAIERAFPEGIVAIGTSALSRLTLPDDNDRHVLAAAIKVRAQLIVTDNLKDFPSSSLEEFELEAVSADQFFVDSITLSESQAVKSIATMRARLNNPAITSEQLILRCEQSGLLETATLLSHHVGLL